MSPTVERAIELWPIQRAARLAGGDKLEVPRTVSHEASFDSGRASRRAASALRDAGFEVQLPKRRGAHLVWFFAAARLSEQSLPDTLRTVDRRIDELGGRYRGWRAPIVSGFDDRPLWRIDLPDRLRASDLPTDPAKYSVDELATMWLAHSASPEDHSDFFDIADDLVWRDPDRALAMILAVLTRIDVAHHVSTTFSLAAGPLEDLLRRHGPVIIDRVLDQAAANPAFAYTLGGVWSSSFDDDLQDPLRGLTEQL